MRVDVRESEGLAGFRPTLFPGLVLWLRADLGVTINDATIANPNAFDNASWTKTGCTVSADATTDPFGGNLADSIIESAGGTFHLVSQNPGSWALGPAATIRVYAKAGARNWAFFGTSNEFTYVNLATGALGTQVGTLISRTVTDAGNGWKLITVTCAPTASSIQFGLASADNTASYSGDGVSNIFLYGASVSQPKVSSWGDQSGQGHNVTQVTTSLQPLFIPSAQNGKPAVRADGVDDSLAAANTNLFGSGAYSIFLGIKPISLVANAAYFVNMTASGGVDIRNSTGNVRGIVHVAVEDHTDAASTTSPEVWSVIRPAATAPSLWVNGASQTLTTATSGLTDPGGTASLIVGAAVGGSPSNEDVYEALAYSRDVTAAERLRIESYMRNRLAL